MPEQSLDYAVVIGLNDYPDFGSQGRPLEGAIEDAERFANWLKDTGTGGGLPDDNCKLILSTPDPLGPTKWPIDQAFGDVIRAARAAGGGRRLYFYFSGHGQAKSAHDVVLCLCNWSSMFRYAALSSALYKDMLLKCSPFAELVVLLDCCRIRSIDATGADSEIGCPVPVDDAGAKRFMIAFATEFQNPAMEAQVQDGTDGDGPIVRGHFTEALLAGLNGGAARPGGGGVTARDLKRYLELNVPRIAQDHQHTQNAQVIADFPEDAQPVFGSALPEANFRIEFSAGRQGEMLLEGPSLEEVRRGDAATGPWHLTLERGRYLLRDLANGQEHDVRFQPAEEVTVVTF
jgi:hypothetical protein